MANSAIGHKTYLGFGEETTWATAVARAKFLEINSETLRVMEDKVVSPSLNRAGIHSGRTEKGAIRVGGGIVFNPNFDGAEKLWRAALHGVPVTSSPDVTNAATVRSHVFPIRDVLSPYSLTMEIFKDVENFLATGVMIDSATWAFRVGQPIECSLDVVAREIAPGSQSAAQTFPSTGLMHGGQATLSWGGTALDVEEAEITINNSLDVDRRFIGSRYISQPHRGGKLAVTGRFVTEFQSTSQYTDFRAHTKRALRIAVTGDAIGATAQTYLFQIDAAVAELREAFPLVGSPGRIKMDIPFACYRNDSDFEMQITARNEVAAV